SLPDIAEVHDSEGSDGLEWEPSGYLVSGHRRVPRMPATRYLDFMFTAKGTLAVNVVPHACRSPTGSFVVTRKAGPTRRWIPSRASWHTFCRDWAPIGRRSS